MAHWGLNAWQKKRVLRGDFKSSKVSDDRIRSSRPFHSSDTLTSDKTTGAIPFKPLKPNHEINSKTDPKPVQGDQNWRQLMGVAIRSPTASDSDYSSWIRCYLQEQRWLNLCFCYKRHCVVLLMFSREKTLTFQAYSIRA